MASSVSVEKAGHLLDYMDAHGDGESVWLRNQSFVVALADKVVELLEDPFGVRQKSASNCILGA